jgi:glycine/D-amino acid oxidase-like deaminating enzyme/predicted methyltransferase
MKVHYLIVGQGLAGSILAWQLMQHEQTVLVVDNEKKNSASKVAAGLINPVTGQRLVKSSDVDSCLQHAINFYQKLEAYFQQQFYFPMPMLRVFRSQPEIDRYKNRCKDHAYQAYLGERFQAGQSGELLNDPLGSVEQLQTGYLAITPLLTALKTYFEEHGAYQSTTFNYRDLTIDHDCVRWKNRQADCVIFCEGANAVNNPWFRWLPFQLSKGEIISFRGGKSVTKKILNDGHWLLPTADDEVKVGATYEWEWSDENPSIDAQKQLIKACEKLTGIDKGWLVIDHKAGIRPTTKDKNPFIGFHPQHRRLAIFNGFGSKGSLLIPFFASEIVEHSTRNTPLPEQADIARFESGISMVTLAKRYLSECIKPGDVVVDATVGNGHDTEFLARCVGPAGKVFGFDVQSEAIKNSVERLARLRLNDRVIFYNANHEFLAESIGSTFQGNIAAIMFNLGYLPGTAKTVKTQSASTINALDQAVKLLKPGGIITVISYVGHQGGSQEANSIQGWLKQSRYENLVVKLKSSSSTKENAPELVVIIKDRV